MDIGNRCVCCGEDTSFGSGKFVNRIPADAEYEVIDEQGNVIFAEGEYRDGYACSECMTIPCYRCDKPIPLDEEFSPNCVYPEDHINHFDNEFSDGADRVCFECLTKEERQYLKEIA